MTDITIECYLWHLFPKMMEEGLIACREFLDEQSRIANHPVPEEEPDILFVWDSISADTLRDYCAKDVEVASALSRRMGVADADGHRNQRRRRRSGTSLH